MDDPALEIKSGLWLTSVTPCWRCGHLAAFAILVATSGTEWLDEEPALIEEPVFVHEPCDLPDEALAQVLDLVSSIWLPEPDDPSDYLRNRCGNCEAYMRDHHLCKVGGALIAEDGTPQPGIFAVPLAGTPFILSDCGVSGGNVQPILDAAQKIG